MGFVFGAFGARLCGPSRSRSASPLSALVQSRWMRNHGLGLPSGASRPLACSSTLALSAIAHNSLHLTSNAMSDGWNWVAGHVVTRSRKAAFCGSDRLAGGRKRAIPAPKGAMSVVS